MEFKELPELVGQPLGWDMLKVIGKDGKKTLIERAFLLKKHVKKYKGKDLSRKSLLCVFTSEKHGKCVAFLEIEDLEGYLLSETVVLHMTSIKYIQDETWQGINFLDQVKRSCRIKTEVLFQLIDSL